MELTAEQQQAQQIMQLRMQVEMLEGENKTLRSKVEYIIEKVLPIVDEIEAVPKFFKIFKVLKLTTKLIDLIITEFRHDSKR